MVADVPAEVEAYFDHSQVEYVGEILCKEGFRATINAKEFDEGILAYVLCNNRNEFINWQYGDRSESPCVPRAFFRHAQSALNKSSSVTCPFSFSDADKYGVEYPEAFI